MFFVNCRHALSGEVQHGFELTGHHVEHPAVWMVKEELRHWSGAAHRRDIRIVQGASDVPNDKPLWDYVDWYHLERAESFGRARGSLVRGLGRAARPCCFGFMDLLLRLH